ncbi:MAG: TetR/AcrR family transcriptional regulator [Verrucomicrobiota bacterium]
MTAEDKNGRSKTPKGKASKGRILDMAEEIFSQKGFIASSVSDVVHGLGISAGALYHHFPSKKALLAGIAKRSMDRLCEQMDSWLGDENLSPGKKVDLFLQAVDDRRRLKKKLAPIEFGIAREDRDVHEMVIQTGLEPITDRLRIIIEEGNTTGEFAVEYPRATATIIFLQLSEFMHRSSRLEKIMPADELESAMSDSINLVLKRDVS